MSEIFLTVNNLYLFICIPRVLIFFYLIQVYGQLRKKYKLDFNIFIMFRFWKQINFISNKFQILNSVQNLNINLIGNIISSIFVRTQFSHWQLYFPVRFKYSLKFFNRELNLIQFKNHWSSFNRYWFLHGFYNLLLLKVSSVYFGKRHYFWNSNLIYFSFQLFPCNVYNLKNSFKVDMANLNVIGWFNYK